MGLRDRFYTPQTAKAILSWRILLGVAVAGIGIVAGLSWPLGLAAGALAYAGSVAMAMPKGRQRPRIDPFTVQEPWRQFVQSAQRSATKLHQTIDAADAGAVKERMQAIGRKLDDGLDDTWRIARRGHDIDGAVHRLDPTALRSKLGTLRVRDESGDVTAAIESVESQLASVDRLKAQSAETADKLRLSQTRLDELVTRAAEVAIGTSDTETYAHDVADLVVELEGLRLAVEETRTA